MMYNCEATGGKMDNYNGFEDYNYDEREDESDTDEDTRRKGD